MRYSQQATVAAPPYRPLVDFPVSKGSGQSLPGWPDAPLWDQLVEGPELQSQGAWEMLRGGGGDGC